MLLKTKKAKAREANRIAEKIKNNMDEFWRTTVSRTRAACIDTGVEQLYDDSSVLIKGILRNGRCIPMKGQFNSMRAICVPAGTESR